MIIPQEEKFFAPRMFVFITRTEEGKKLQEIFDSMHIHISYQCRGQGTAPSELLDIFGLGGTTRLITVGFLPKHAVRDLFKKAGMQFAFHQRGGGIAVSIPITGLQGPVLQMLNEEARDIIEKKVKERIESDMAEIREKSRFNVIWVSVSAGYSDEVIDTARKAGAKGGTVLRGRRRSSEHASQHFGVSLQDEQDFVMIIALKEKKKEIMSAICNSYGIHSPAHGTVISLPVDEAIGLEE